MQLALFDLLERQVAVNDKNSDIESLGLQPELSMHVDYPLDEERPASVLDLSRQLHLLQIVLIHLKVSFHFAHVLVDIICELGYHLRVSNLQLVRKDHFLAHVPPMTH